MVVDLLISLWDEGWKGMEKCWGNGCTVYHDGIFFGGWKGWAILIAILGHLECATKIYGIDVPLYGDISIPCARGGLAYCAVPSGNSGKAHSIKSLESHMPCHLNCTERVKINNTSLPTNPTKHERRLNP